MIKDIFPMQIYETHYDEFYKIKAEIIEKIMVLYTNTNEREKHLGEELSKYLLENGYGQGSVTSLKPFSRKLHNQINISPIFDFIIQHTNKFWKDIKFNSSYKPVLTNSWIYKESPDGNLDWHNHTSSVISGVFYINATPEMGNLMLENPSCLLLGSMPFEKNSWGPLLFDHVINVEDGKLVLFPGWMKHKTLKNKTNTDRIVLAFDFGVSPK
jgi:uncharacterized protein (TIGR02466 family)